MRCTAGRDGGGEMGLGCRCCWSLDQTEYILYYSFVSFSTISTCCEVNDQHGEKLPSNMLFGLRGEQRAQVGKETKKHSALNEEVAGGSCRLVHKE